MVVQFIMVLPVLIVLTYSVIEFWYVLRLRDTAHHYMSQALARMTIEGYLPVTTETVLRNNLTSLGCKDILIENIADDPDNLLDNTAMESAGDNRILRPNDIELKLACVPVNRPLTMGLLVGSRIPDGEFAIRVGGRSISERVDP